ncbi:MAG: alpha/beta fold hydrolase [Kiritimatiellae bacterium]|nr:alpha/beta fold hydrolase [Kiritimatiellia bacterium]
MNELNVATRRGTVLNGALFRSPGKADTLVIAITGIHGNFYSNPFYYDIGDALNTAGIDFAYAQTRNAFGVIKTRNVLTKKEEMIGSWNERFADTDEDIAAYLDEVERRGYRHVILAGHSLGANKVIYYLSRHHDPRVKHFILMSPANVDYMTSGVMREEREIVAALMAQGKGCEMLPFPLMGWVDCTVATATDWLGPTLNNVRTAPGGDWSQISHVTHTGALLIGTYDRFTDGDPAAFLENINSHFPKADENKLVFIEKTGHTYQQKHREVADAITRLVLGWHRKETHEEPV